MGAYLKMLLSSIFDSLRAQSYKKADLGCGAPEEKEHGIFLNQFCH